jgi:CHAD domain-containing protein
MIKNGKWVGTCRRKDPVWVVAAATIELRLAAVRHFLPLAAEQSKEDLEYVHQLRVSTRRMVAALDLYADFLPKKPTRRLRRRLKQIRRAAGNARDCDVLLMRNEDCEGDPRAQRFVESVRRKRRDAQAPITVVFQAVQGKGGLDRLATKLFVALRSAHAGETKPRFGPWSRKQLQIVVNDFFASQPRDLCDLHGLHEFRIAGKRLRYTMELLASAFPDALREDLYPTIEIIQESLGGINDHAVALQRFRAWRKETNNRLERTHLKKLIRLEEKALQQAVNQFAKWWTPKRTRKLRKRFRRLTVPS